MMITISLALLVIKIPFPPAPYMVYDAADVPIYISTFAYGPGAGLLVTLVVCLLQAFLMAGDGIYGFLMHFVATGIVVLVIGAMYKHEKTKSMAIKSLVVGVILTTFVMCIMNIIVTPMYTGAPREAVLAMIPTIIIPFNLLKSGINSAITFIVYKRISGFLHGSTGTVRK